MPERFHIAGRSYVREELTQEAQRRLTLTGLTEFEKDAWSFIQNWLDRTDEVQTMTSGSTHSPTLASIPKSWMRASAHATTLALGLEAGMKALLCISPKYIGGMMMIVRSLELGMDLYMEDPSTVHIAKGTFDFTAMVPLQVRRLLHEGSDLSEFGILIIGGAPIDPHTALRLSACPNPIYATFGMTETLSHVALKRLNGADPSPNFEAITGVHLSVNDEGLLHIRIPSMDDLEVQSNDRVELIDERHFRWIGRADHVINSGGIKIHPEEIETLLAELLTVPFFIHKEVHAQYGETAVLCIEGEDKFVEDILEAMKARVPEHHAPTRVYSMDSFLRTDTGKVIRSSSFDQKKKRLF